MELLAAIVTVLMGSAAAARFIYKAIKKQKTLRTQYRA